MQLQEKTVEQVRIVTIEETRIDAVIADELKKQVFELLKTAPPHLLLNMKEVSIIDSSALGVFALVYKACKKQGEFALCEVRKNVQTLLRMTRLDQVFPCYPTEEEAIAALAKNVPVAQNTGK
ncbi:MAG: anti-sigma factor antagonist [Nitrospirales bacterium]|nr:MAG: anti-sigma factor antagonist [Nitrospirales bacterium]